MSRQPLRIGLVGAGHIARAHLKAWRSAPGCRVTAVLDRERSAAEARAREFGIGQVLDDLESLLATSDVVDVCTPPHTHAAIAKQVVSAGRHLLIEKPVVTDLSDWDEIRRLLSRHSVEIAVLHNLKFARSIQQTKRWLEQGRLGRALRLTRQFLTDPGNDRMLTADRHWSHELPGGRWFETLPHELYLTHYLVGPLQLYHVTVAHTENAPAGAQADEVVVTLRGEQCLATFHYSANCKLNRRDLIIHGTEGSALVDVLSDSATLSRRRDGRWLRAGFGALIDQGLEFVHWVPDRAAYLADRLHGKTAHARLIADFARHLRGDGPHPTPVEEIDYVARNCDRIGREIDRRISEVGGAAN